MRIFKLVWLVIAAVLILAGLISMTRHDPKSEEARRSYLMMVIGSFMSAVYYLTRLGEYVSEHITSDLQNFF